MDEQPPPDAQPPESPRKMFLEFTVEGRTKIVEHFREHTETLRTSSMSHVDQARKLLFTLNAGAAVAMLTFMGSSKTILQSGHAWIALGAFVAGLLGLVVFQAVETHVAINNLLGWLQRTEQVYENKVDVDEPARWSQRLISKQRRFFIAPYASVGAWFLGVIWAGCHLPQLAVHEREAEAAAASAPVSVRVVQTPATLSVPQPTPAMPATLSAPAPLIPATSAPATPAPIPPH